jgi:hypothetical protein
MVEIMPKLFATNFCRSGMCVWQQLGMALLIADELSDEQNHVAEKRRVQELKNEARRLMEEEEIHHDIGIKT